MSKKKKEIAVKLGAEAAEPVTPGDVNIFYGHDLIAGLSEDSSARLETENTIVVKDIGVEYTKPSTSLPSIAGTFPDVSVRFTCDQQVKIVDGQIYSVSHTHLPLQVDELKYIPSNVDNIISFDGEIVAPADIYNVSVNGVTKIFDSREGIYNLHTVLDDYMTDITITVTYKE